MKNRPDKSDSKFAAGKAPGKMSAKPGAKPVQGAKPFVKRTTGDAPAPRGGEIAPGRALSQGKHEGAAKGKPARFAGEKPAYPRQERSAGRSSSGAYSGAPSSEDRIAPGRALPQGKHEGPA
ncbi:hypothetical protein, partial [Geomesophilobacter sediminis]